MKMSNINDYVQNANLPLFVLPEHRPIFVLTDSSRLLGTNLVASEAHYERKDLQQKWIVLTHI